jgi:hypothetical protein
MVSFRSATRWFTSPPTAKSSANSKSVSCRPRWPPVKFLPTASSGARACLRGVPCANWCCPRVLCEFNQRPTRAQHPPPPRSPGCQPRVRIPRTRLRNRLPRPARQKSPSLLPLRHRLNSPPARCNRRSPPQVPSKHHHARPSRYLSGNAFSGGTPASRQRPRPHRQPAKRPKRKRQAPVSAPRQPRNWVLPLPGSRRMFPGCQRQPAPLRSIP